LGIGPKKIATIKDKKDLFVAVPLAIKMFLYKLTNSLTASNQNCQ
jgi:hypothetical protein